MSAATVAEPLWLTTLRRAVKASSLPVVGRQIGYSTGAISAVLNGKYTASLDRVQRAVEGALMGSSIACPVVGDIPSQRCVEHQSAPFAATNPMRVRLYRACRSGCPHSMIKPAGAGGKEPL